jgi:hypothetical protein
LDIQCSLDLLQRMHPGDCEHCPYMANSPASKLPRRIKLPALAVVR